jgi:two-component system nitrogen regulation sensor histidine kinase NtrY
MDTTHPSYSSKLTAWLRHISERSISTKVSLLLALAAVVSGLATYAAFNESPPFGDSPNTVIWLLNLDLLILLALFALVARRIAKIWTSKRQGLAGSSLQAQLVMIFAVMAGIPALVMTLFSAFFFHYGVQTWFSDRVSTAVLNAQAVAEAYVEENQKSIRGDLLLLMQDITKNAEYIVDDKGAFVAFLQDQSFNRNFSEIVVFDGTRRVIGSAGFTFSLAFENLIADLPEQVLNQAREGELVIMTSGTDDRVRALLQLNNIQDTFIFVGRMVDPTVIDHLEQTRTASAQYEFLQGQYSGLQITVTLIFIVVALFLLLAAVSAGIGLARKMVAPIGTLVSTADRVRAGDLTARVPTIEKFEEFEFLAQSFNRMTSQLQDQRDELVLANRQMDERRRFTEAVLAGVSSGILGVSNEGVIRIANISAHDLLEEEEGSLQGQKITDILPECADLLNDAHNRPNKIVQMEIPFTKSNGSTRTFLARGAVERIGDQDKGAVITFDDITELQSAQRKAAWADVARRIAHEIKNPLTPIQLSAERLKRKYLKEIKTDPDIFSQCTDTIVKHVDDIGRMVSEFSSFARMPEPVLKDENIVRQILETLTLQKQAHPKIAFSYAGLEEENNKVIVSCDVRQLRQALTNLTVNAIDSIDAKTKDDPTLKGRLHYTFAILDDEQCILSLSDNGKGFPEGEKVEKLTEPYVTHKEKGTGLGLAIVQKIMEDHHGKLILGVPTWLQNVKGFEDLGGAVVSLLLPLKTDEHQKDKVA